MGKIGENIRNFRKFRGIKQQDLADMLDRTKSVISNWERGANFPDVETCEKLCKILQVTPNELFGWEENKEYLNYQRRVYEYQLRIERLQKQKQAIEFEIHNLEEQKFKEYPPEDFAED